MPAVSSSNSCTRTCAGVEDAFLTLETELRMSIFLTKAYSSCNPIIQLSFDFLNENFGLRAALVSCTHGPTGEQVAQNVPMESMGSAK